jgi:hypothetical protein
MDRKVRILSSRYRLERKNAALSVERVGSITVSVCPSQQESMPGKQISLCPVQWIEKCAFSPADIGSERMRPSLWKGLVDRRSTLKNRRRNSHVKVKL